MFSGLFCLHMYVKPEYLGVYYANWNLCRLCSRLAVWFWWIQALPASDAATRLLSDAFESRSGNWAVILPRIWQFSKLGSVGSIAVIRLILWAPVEVCVPGLAADLLTIREGVSACQRKGGGWHQWTYGYYLRMQPETLVPFSKALRAKYWWIIVGNKMLRHQNSIEKCKPPPYIYHCFRVRRERCEPPLNFFLFTLFLRWKD